MSLPGAPSSVPAPGRFLWLQRHSSWRLRECPQQHALMLFYQSLPWLGSWLTLVRLLWGHDSLVPFGGFPESQKVTQSCPALRPHGPYSPWHSPGQNSGVGSLSLLQGIFPTQELKRGLLHCRRILYNWAIREGPAFSFFLLKEETFCLHHVTNISVSYSSHLCKKTNWRHSICLFVSLQRFLGVQLLPASI